MKMLMMLFALSFIGSAYALKVGECTNLGVDWSVYRKNDSKIYDIRTKYGKLGCLRTKEENVFTTKREIGVFEPAASAKLIGIIDRKTEAGFPVKIFLFNEDSECLPNYKK